MGAPGAGGGTVYDFKLDSSQNVWAQSAAYTACDGSPLGWNMANEGTLVVSGKTKELLWDTSQTASGCIGDVDGGAPDASAD